jgi:hypothetical protein
MGDAIAPSLTDLARRAHKMRRVGTKEWDLQVEQKNERKGKNERGELDKGSTHISGLDDVRSAG